MFEIKRNLCFFLLFLFVDLTVLTFAVHPPFYALKIIWFPFDTSTSDILVFQFFLTLCISFIFISVIVKSWDEQFHMSSYIITRSSIGHTYLISYKVVVRNIFAVMLIKAIVDIIMGQIDGWTNFNDYFWYTISAFLTISLWAIGIHLMKLFHIRTNMVYFLFGLIIVMSQYTAFYSPVFFVFVVGSKQLVETPSLVIVSKIVFIVILFIVDWKKYQKYEYVGEEK